MRGGAVSNSYPLCRLGRLGPGFGAYEAGTARHAQALPRRCQSALNESRIRTNAIFFELLPAVASDPDELAELERSIRMTVPQTTGEEAARAAGWLARHVAVGRHVQNAAAETSPLHAEMRVGALATVPGTGPPCRRVCTAVVGNEFSIWEFDGVRSFVLQKASLAV